MTAFDLMDQRIAELDRLTRATTGALDVEEGKGLQLLLSNLQWLRRFKGVPSLPVQETSGANISALRSTLDCPAETISICTTIAS